MARKGENVPPHPYLSFLETFWRFWTSHCQTAFGNPQFYDLPPSSKALGFENATYHDIVLGCGLECVMQCSPSSSRQAGAFHQERVGASVRSPEKIQRRRILNRVPLLYTVNEVT